MIHYHGTPITPDVTLAQAMTGAHFFVSHENPEQLGLIATVGSSFAADCGSYTKWRNGDKTETDWLPYYDWIQDIRRNPKFDWAIIPDVIDGDEAANDALLEEWPFPDRIGAPVWHLHESIARLVMLAERFPLVCFGSSGPYATIKSVRWWARMAEAMAAVCDKDGFPTCRIHGLRMLDAEVVVAFPFRSADSTNVARNVNIDKRWTGSYQPPTKAGRASIMRQRIEVVQSPVIWTPDAPQIDEEAAMSLFAL